MIQICILKFSSHIELICLNLSIFHFLKISFAFASEYPIRPNQNFGFNLTQMPSAFTTSYHFWLKLTFNDTNMHFEVFKSHRVDLVESEHISFSQNLSFDLHWVPYQTPSKFWLQSYPNSLSFHHKLPFLTYIDFQCYKNCFSKVSH